MNSIRQTLLLVALSVPALSAADADSNLRDARASARVGLIQSDNKEAPKTYIVQLQRPPAAVQFADTLNAARASTPKGKERVRFDKSRADVQSYAEKLVDEQDSVLSRAGTGAKKLYSYRYGLNGFAARLTPAQAHKLEHLPEVVAVWEDEIRPLATNFSPDFLKLFDNTAGLRGPLGLDGEDLVIGVIDSGIYPEHPALRDTREAPRPRLCGGSWAENTLLGRWLCRRYRRAPDTVIFEEPTNWGGSCETGDRFTETECNNKLIGARWFVDGADASGELDPGEIRSARDVDGHGTHTATTAAGNRVDASIFGTRIGPVQGMAPRARVAVYKACWLRPGDQRASCNTSDLARAIDAAVADGVDIINYSVGSSFRKISAPDDVALLAAAKAGVLAAVAAGNEGPNLSTIGSPAGGPWVITAAASSREGEISLEAMQINAPAAIAGKYAVREANFTPALMDNDPIEAELVLADDDQQVLVDGSAGTTSDACEALVNTDAIKDRIALIQRGGCEFDVKVQNAEDAGAVAAVVFNLAGPPIVMNGDASLSNIPALMVGQADGMLFIEQFDAGESISAVLDKGFFLTESETGDVMASFSARGPGPLQEVLKPDVSAPGVSILAGFTPDAVNATPDESFGYLSGTSMATPHVAGIAALLLQAHPDWSPAAIKSALMTTAHQSLTESDGQTAANPFGFGAGHIVPNLAVDPGLVYDANDDDYDAVACGLAISSIPTARCEALVNAGRSLRAADMNQPSISISRLANQRTVTRRVTNVSDSSESYVAAMTPPVGMQVAVNPASLSLAAGETGSFDVTVQYLSGPLDLWRFGSLTWNSSDHSVRSTIAVKPITLTAPAEVTGFGGTGSTEFAVEFGYSGTYTARVHGLRLPLILNGFVDNDPSKTFTFRETNGVTAHLISVPAQQLYARFSLFDALTDGEDDLDMFVYFCADAMQISLATCTKIGESGEPTSQERFDVFRPAAGQYLILVHGFATDEVAGGPGANYQLLSWAFGENDDRGNMTVAGPAFVNTGSTETITVDWSNLNSDTVYLGGISHNTPQGLSGLTLITIGN